MELLYLYVMRNFCGEKFHFCGCRRNLNTWPGKNHLVSAADHSETGRRSLENWLQIAQKSLGKITDRPQITSHGQRRGRAPWPAPRPAPRPALWPAPWPAPAPRPVPWPIPWTFQEWKINEQRTTVDFSQIFYY